MTTKEYIEDTISMILYALPFVVLPIIAGEILGQTVERFAFGLVVATFAGKRASFFLQLERANDRAKELLRKNAEDDHFIIDETEDDEERRDMS